jgi:hypothetical protein
MDAHRNSFFGKDSKMLKQISTCCFIVIVGLATVLATAVPAFAQQTIVYVDGENGNTNAPSGSNPGNGWNSAGYKFLQSGLTRADQIHSEPGQGNLLIQIWVRGKPASQGGLVYRPDQDSNSPSGSGDPDASFLLRNNVRICAGFDTDETGTEPQQFMQRRPYENICILSGDLANDDDPQDPFDPDLIDENSHHILRAIRVDGTAISRP